MKDGIGDRPGEAPGPQRLKLFRDVADDWNERRVNLSERGPWRRRRSSESTSDGSALTKTVTHSFHGIHRLSGVTARGAGTPGAKADEAPTE